MGQVFDAPALTLTAGHAALHQALLGDRMRLPLDAALCEAVTGEEQPLAHPNLVCDVAIGQSTGPTQRVRGNLFYRGLVLLRPVFIGDTLRTRTEVVALKQNRRAGPRPPDWWRCESDGQPARRAGARLLALRDDPAARPRRTHRPRGRVRRDPAGARPGRGSARQRRATGATTCTREGLPGEHFADMQAGTVLRDRGPRHGDRAAELARLTLNVARAHTDAGASVHGRRLAYGGHTIAVAAAQATRALPNLLTIVAWRWCEHTGPVFDGDLLATELTVGRGLHPLELDGPGLADLRASHDRRARRATAPSRSLTGASLASRLMDERAGILDGMRVVEGSAYVAAPLGGMTLAQLGADVIRFDPIGGGLDRNRWPVTDDGASLFWAGLNKGKRSIQVDLRSDRGQELLAELIAAPGAGRRHLPHQLPGPGLALLRRAGGSARATCHGQHHRQPRRHAPPSTTRSTPPPASRGRPGPRNLGVPFNHLLPAWDAITGTLAAAGLLAAERHRRRTGEGQHVSVALSDVAFAMVGNLGKIAEAQLLRRERPKDGNYLYGAFGRDFITEDGRRIMVVALTPRQWRSLVEATGLADAFDAGRADAGLRPHARKATASRRARCSARSSSRGPSPGRSPRSRAVFDGHDVCWGPYQTFMELVDEDPRCSTENPLFEEVEQPGIGTYLMAGSPLDFSSTERLPAAPGAGARRAHRRGAGRRARPERRRDRPPARRRGRCRPVPAGA